jgi:DNA-binding IclR family transcriptional regulator
MAPQRLVQSVVRSLEILEALAGSHELGLAEIASRTGLGASTVHRLLATLVARGYVVQSRTSRRYLLGYKLAELAGVLSDRTDQLCQLARPHLVAIREATGESANLSVLVPPNAVYVDNVDGTHGVRMLARIGTAVPAHASAAGKAILAFVPRDSVGAIVGSEPLRALTPNTITTLDALADELVAIRAVGYATDNEEHESGVGCVAAPIFDDDVGVIAAVSVSAPTQRIDANDPAKLGLLLAERATAISHAIRRNDKQTEAAPSSVPPAAGPGEPGPA